MILDSLTPAFYDNIFDLLKASTEVEHGCRMCQKGKFILPGKNCSGDECSIYIDKFPKCPKNTEDIGLFHVHTSGSTNPSPSDHAIVADQLLQHWHDSRKDQRYHFGIVSQRDQKVRFMTYSCSRLATSKNACNRLNAKIKLIHKRADKYVAITQGVVESKEAEDARKSVDDMIKPFIEDKSVVEIDLQRVRELTDVDVVALSELEEHYGRKRRTR